MVPGFFVLACRCQTFHIFITLFAYTLGIEDALHTCVSLVPFIHAQKVGKNVGLRALL